MTKIRFEDDIYTTSSLYKVHLEYCEKNNLKPVTLTSFQKRFYKQRPIKKTVYTPNEGRGGCRNDKGLKKIYEKNKKQYSLLYQSFIRLLRKGFTIEEALNHVNLKYRDRYERIYKLN